MASKNKSLPLTNMLKNSEIDTIRKSFSDIGQLVQLPESVYKYRAAWANCSEEKASSFQKGWLNAGFIVSDINMDEQWVEFKKGAPQTRRTQNKKAVSDVVVDEGALEEAIQKGYNCYNSMCADTHHRYLSWEHCHKVFINQHKIKSKKVDYDTLCLNLAWYLASWGMLRNSFLMKKDYKIHDKLVKLVFDKRWDSLWDITADELAKENNAQKIIELKEEVIQAYRDNGISENLTDTLITKILLGTIGCVPAFDRYFKTGIKSVRVASQQFSKQSIISLGKVYVTYKKQFERLCSHCSQNGVKYPAAKILDMCFFEYGLYKSGNDENAEE